MSADADKVNHPSQYQSGGIEAIAVIEALGWGEGFCKGNALKYLMRAGRKDGESEADDIAKARWYLDRYAELLKAKSND